MTAEPQFQVIPKFSYAFYLVGPALQFYRYQLFRVSYPIELYPVALVLDSDVWAELNHNKSDAQAQNRLYAHTEAEFVEVLKRIFSAQKTLRVIKAIYSQSQSAAPVSVPVAAD